MGSFHALVRASQKKSKHLFRTLGILSENKILTLLLSMKPSSLLLLFPPLLDLLCNNFGLNVLENEKLHQFWNWEAKLNGY